MIALSNEFTRRVGLEVPIVQAPMARAGTAELVTAVCNAGGLGSIAGALLEPQALHAEIDRVRAATARPFNVNLFVLEAAAAKHADIERGLAILRPFLEELGVAPQGGPLPPAPDFRSQLDVVLECAPRVASFTFGLLEAEAVRKLRSAGILVMGTATTVAEALAWEGVGADFICAQGWEAGGHRGTFLGDMDRSGVGLMALLAQMTVRVRLPIVAAGGIMDGRGIAAAMMLGAQAAQLGTAFLTCPESGISPQWKNALRGARDDATRLTRLYTGRSVRVLVNRFTEQARAFEDDAPEYFVQRALTAQLLIAAQKAGAADLLPFLSGQAASLSRGLPAAELVTTLMRELRATGA
jgi:nitronate monooxygenase